MRSNKKHVHTAVCYIKMKKIMQICKQAAVDQFLILLHRNDNMGNAKFYIHTVKGHSIAFYSVTLGQFPYLGALQYSKDIKASAVQKFFMQFSCIQLLLRKSTSWPLYALPALHHPYKVRTCLAGHVFIP